MCAHGLVRTERGEGSHYDPMWFHASIFSGIWDCLAWLVT